MSMSKLAKIAVILLGVGFILFFIGNLLGGKGIVINSKFQISTPGDLDYCEYENKDLEGFTSININVSNMPVTFLPSENGLYGVKLAYYASDKDNMLIEVKDDTLTIRRKTEMYWFSFDFSFLDGGQINKEYITVYLPKQDYESIDVSDSNGAITMEKMNIDVKNLILDTSNAPIIISDLKADMVSADSSNGMMNLSDITSGKIRVKTSNAMVVVEDCDAAVLDIRTSNGMVTLDGVTFEDGDGDFSVSTSNGVITVNLLEWREADFRIDASTSNANIYVNDENQKDNKYKTKAGNNRLHLKTSNSRIEMNFGLD